jgi:hypothetical protein
MCKSETIVDAILSHKATGRKKTLYEISWNDGTTTFESATNLCDVDEGETIFNDKLVAYWKKHPQLRQRDGF